VTLNFSPEDYSADFKKIFQKQTRKHLEKWSNTSNGTIEFIEEENPGFFSSGIYFYIGGNEELFAKIDADCIVVSFILFSIIKRQKVPIGTISRS